MKYISENGCLLLNLDIWGFITEKGKFNGKHMNILLSTIGKRNYIAKYFKEILPPESKIVGTSNSEHTIGFLACDCSFIIPSFTENGYSDAIVEICEKEKINAIFTLSDLELPYIAKLKYKLQNMHIKCFFPNENTVNRFLNKHETFIFLKRNNFFTPETFTSLEEAIKKLGFPMVIKPRDGYASQGFLIVHDKVTALNHWTKIQNPIAQEYLQGKLINVEACSDAFGRILSLCSWIKHSSVAGETLIAQSKIDLNAINLVQKLLTLSPIPGPIDVDLIEHNGELFILEVNTRFGGGYPVSHLAGADFPRKLYDSIINIYPEKLISIEENIIMMKELVPVQYNPVVNYYR
jgi:carbamoyl-phosphate synthase large subunit